jgi:hypothetical protein
MWFLLSILGSIMSNIEIGMANPVRILSAALLFGVLAYATAGVAPVAAYDGLEGDFQECTQGGGNMPSDQVVAACSRLIDNAAEENETVGFFYALRASESSDRTQNCSDAKKAAQLIKASDLQSLIQQLQDANC